MLVVTAWVFCACGCAGGGGRIQAAASTASAPECETWIAPFITGSTMIEPPHGDGGERAHSGRSGLFSLVRCWEDFFGEQSFIRDPDLLEHQGCKTHKNCIICQCRLDFAPFVGKFCP